MSIDKVIIERLHANGFEVYTVGGYVRDLLMEMSPKDRDYATNATPDEIEKIFSDKKVVSQVGKDFKVIIIENTEVATFRKDVQTVMYDAKHCKPVYAKSIHEDMERRDLTFNAMAIEPISGALIDNHGGLHDLEHGIIKFVGDPRRRIDEDPARMVRASRFFAQYGLVFDYDSLAAMMDRAYLIKKYFRPDKIRNEIMKAMELPYPSVFFSVLHYVGILKDLMPQLDACFGHTGGAHHIEDVGEHCMAAGDYIHKKFPLLRLAGFMHDIGKPLAYNPKDGSFLNHENIGAGLVKKYLTELRFSNHDVEQVTNLVATHMRVCATLTPKGQRRLAKHLGDSNLDPHDFLRLKLADRAANMKRDANRFGPIKNMAKKVFLRGMEKLPMTTNDLAVKGGQLIEILKLTPGPIVSELQKHLLNFVIENGEELNTYVTLVAEAQRYLEELNEKHG